MSAKTNTRGLRTYGRHRQRVVKDVKDVWSQALTKDRSKDVFSISSNDSSSQNSTGNSSNGSLFVPRKTGVQKSRRKDRNKENEHSRPHRKTQARQRKILDSAGLDTCSSHESEDSLFYNPRPRGVLKDRNTNQNVTKSYGKRKREGKSLLHQITRGIDSSKESSGITCNFSEFDDYSLVISGSSPPDQHGGTPVSRNLRSCKKNSDNIETSTPCAKRFQAGTPVAKIKAANLSHIELVESPIAYQTANSTNLGVGEYSHGGVYAADESCRSDQSKPSYAARGEGTSVSERDCISVHKDLSVFRLNGSHGEQRSRQSVDSNSSKYNSCSSFQCSPCEVQLERLERSLLSLFVSRRQSRGGRGRDSVSHNFNHSNSLFSSINSSIGGVSATIPQKPTDANAHEEEEEDEDATSDEETDEDEGDGVVERDDEEEDETEDELTDIDEVEEESDENEVIHEADMPHVIDSPDETRYFLSTESYLESSRESKKSSDNRRLASVSDAEEEEEDDDDDGDDDGDDDAGHSDASSHERFESAEDSLCDSSLEISWKNIRKSLNKSTFDMITPKKKPQVPEVSPRSQVLQVCQQEDIMTFSQCIPHRMLKKCIKVGEGVYGEVFRTQNKDNQTVVYKIIPIEGDFNVNDEPQKTFEEILPEIVISQELSLLREHDTVFTPNFCRVNNVSCVAGAYPAHLLQEWDAYNEHGQSENDRPDVFQSDQLFIIFEFDDGGKALETCQFHNILQAKSALAQVAFSLAVAEEAMEFEHRDLHWGNVLVKKTPNKHMVYTLMGRDHKIETHTVDVCLIDFTLSRLKKDNCIVYNNLASDETLFEGHGDLQFDIYRQMKEFNSNDWEAFHPRSNVLWLHYLADKLLHMKRFTRNNKEDQKILRKFRLFSKTILDYNSACELVTCSDFLKT